MPHTNSEIEQRAITTLFEEMDSYDNATADMRTKWKECWNLYNNKLEKTDFPWLSRKFIPKVHKSVNLLTAFMAGGNPQINVYPQGEEDEVKSDFMRELLQFQWNNVLHMRLKLLNTVKSSILFGTGILKVGWLTKMTEYPMGEKKKPKRFIEYDDPFVEGVNIFDFWTDPYAPTISDSYSNIERWVMTLQQVKSNPAYKNAHLLKAQGFVHTESVRHDSAGLNLTDLSEMTDPIDRVEVFEREGLFEMNGKMVETIITIANANDPVVLRIVPNGDGFRHHVELKFTEPPIPNRFYGIGAIEPNINTQRGINSLTNQIVDIITSQINPMFVRRRGANIDPKQLVWRPSGFIDVDDVALDVRQLDVVDKSNAGFNLLQYLNSEFEEGTSVTPTRKGEGSSGTATEASIQERNVTIQTNLFKEAIEEMISELGKRLVDLNVRNITSAKSIRIFDFDSIKRVRGIVDEATKGITLPHLDQEKLGRYGLLLKFASGKTLSGQYDVKVVADSTILYDRNILRKQLMDWALTMAKMGFGERLNLEEISKDFGELAGLPNARKYIKQEEVLPPQPGPEAPPPLPQMGGNPASRNRIGEQGIATPLPNEQNSTADIAKSIQARAGGI